MARRKGSGDKYLDCLVEHLEKAVGMGKTRIGEAKDEYVRQTEANQEKGLGLNDARTKAMAFIHDALDQSKIAKQKRIDATAKRISEFEARRTETLGVKMPFRGSPAERIGRMLRSMIEDDPILKTAEHNFVAEAEIAEKHMFSMFRNVIDDFSQNWAGIRRGSVEDADIANEFKKPGSSNNKVAADIANAIRQIHKYYISEINLHGASVKHTEGEMVWKPVSSKITNEAELINDIKANINWNTSGAGHYVRLGERDEWVKKYVRAAFENKWDGMPRPYEHTGGEFARDFHNDRMVQFKDGASHDFMSKKYMDGGIYQTTLHSIQKMAHNMAVVKIFGPSPNHTVKLFRDMAEKAYLDVTPIGTSPTKINKHLKKYDTMTDIVLRHNAMDPEGRLGAMVNASSNLMTTAMLSQASFLSIPGDIATMMANRLANNEPVLRAVGSYIQAMSQIKNARREMLHAGWGASEFTSSTFYQSRYDYGAQFGPTWTKYLADKTMRLNLMNRGFDAVRAADTRARAASLYEARNTAWSQLRERGMLERAGFTEAEWKKTAKAMETKVYSPNDEIGMFRPFDHYDALGSDLTHKWQRFYYNQSRRSVIENTVESRAMLMGNTRADTLTGAIANSFARFHGYPTTFFMSMARSAMSADTVGGVIWNLTRTGGMVAMAAAMGIQAKNFWQGKEFQDMRDPEFWLKASMSSGAFSIWGDYVVGGMRADPATTISKAIGGPLVEMFADAIALTEGSAFQALEIGEHSGKWTLGKTGVDAVDFLRKYMIPEPFFVAPLIQRNLLELLQEQMSPKTMAKRYKGQNKAQEKAGTPQKPGTGPGSRNPLPFLGGQ